MKYIVLSIIASIHFACFGAAHNRVELTSLITIFENPESDIKPDFAIKCVKSDKVIACLLAGENIQGESAAELVDRLAKLKIDTSKRDGIDHEGIRNALPTSCKWAIAIILQRESLLDDNLFLHKSTNIHIEGTATYPPHHLCGDFYFKLSNSSKPTLTIHPSSTDRLETNELGILINKKEAAEWFDQEADFYTRRVDPLCCSIS